MSMWPTTYKQYVASRNQSNGDTVYQQCGEPADLATRDVPAESCGEFTVIDGAKLSQRNTNC